ncbi:hemin uptake protein HemP [Halomonas sp. LS-001]
MKDSSETLFGATAANKPGAPVDGEMPANEAHSEQLLGDAGQLVIIHQQKRYLLRRTKSGKLILTA